MADSARIPVTRPFLSVIPARCPELAKRGIPAVVHSDRVAAQRL